MGRWFVKLIPMVIAAFCGSGAAGAETVRFDLVPAVGDPITLSAEITKPQGPGPFPAVVMMHGCGGPWAPWGDPWSKRLVGWGYVAVRVDSFGPRGHSVGICGSPRTVPSTTRGADAHAAKSHLKELAYVDGGRIAVMGVSHGGWAAMSAVENAHRGQAPRPEPFRASIAFYPYCRRVLQRPDAPVLVLIGEADRWTPAHRCTDMAVRGPTEHAVTVVTFPGATHAFDVDLPDREYRGHAIKFDRPALRDAEARVRAFLAENFK